MDKEILELLKAMQSDINGIKSDVTDMKGDITNMKTDIINLKEGQNRIEKKLDAVVEQTADLTEFRTETRESLTNIHTVVEDIKKDLNVVEAVSAKNWN